MKSLILAVAVFAVPALADQENCGPRSRADNARAAVDQFRESTQELLDNSSGEENAEQIQRQARALLQASANLKGALSSRRICFEPIERLSREVQRTGRNLVATARGDNSFDVVFRTGRVAGSGDQLQVDLTQLLKRLDPR